MLERIYNKLLWASKTTTPILLFLFFFSTLLLFFLRWHSATNEIDNTSGDQLYYLNEVIKLSEHGAYRVMSEGTSIVYSFIVLLLSKLTSLKLLVVGKLMNFFFLPATGVVFYFLSRVAFKASIQFSVFVSILYVLSFQHYCFKMLSDITNNFFLISGVLMFFMSQKNNKNKRGVFIIISAALFSISIGVRPTSILFSLAFITALFLLKKINLKDKIQFLIVVSTCFIFLQLPSLVEKQKISLEDKNKIWQGKAKVDKPVSWALINAYYVLYPERHKKRSKFMIDTKEVELFYQKNPKKLPTSTIQILLKSPKKTILQLATNWKQINVYFWSPLGLGLIWSNALATIVSFILTPLILIYFLLKIKKELSFKLTALSTLIYLATLLYSSIALIESNWVFVCVPFSLLWYYLFANNKKHFNLAFTYLILVNTFSSLLTIRHVYASL